ncbi:hypothetical protein T07_6343 [Trichinella nelsoni]|uniref:Uncharacterized protein n=1 Tax=Trichinella nelsoni TaxID=6336 RepID=A0A0V0RI93_9BILA|nr:hypothetical protein T07_6343 [Trichinella nelsoni]
MNAIEQFLILIALAIVGRLSRHQYIPSVALQKQVSAYYKNRSGSDSVPQSNYCSFGISTFQMWHHKFAPGFALRLRPRANKNLHIPSGYARGNFLHQISPPGAFMQIFNTLGAICKFLYALRLRPRLCLRQFFEIFENFKI